MTAHESPLLGLAAPAEEFDALTVREVVATWDGSADSPAIKGAHRTEALAAVIVESGTSRFLALVPPGAPDGISVYGPYPSFADHADLDLWRALTRDALSNDTHVRVAGWALSWLSCSRPTMRS